MKVTKIFSDKNHCWYMFGRDPEKPDGIIDTNQYMVHSDNKVLLMDPGGIELFSAMLAAVIKHVPLEDVTDIFASHQDPDIISSLGLWDQSLPKATLHAPWLWESFLRHFGMTNIKYNAIPDEGETLKLGDTSLQLVPAHYLHSSGNFHLYDERAKILMSGDVGAALESDQAPLYVEDFDEHIPKMKTFHQRWMPSNRAKHDWIERVSLLDIELLAPQHGRMFTGDNVKRFLEWFDKLDVGSAIESRELVQE